MKKNLILCLMLAACASDDAGPECTAATTYQGETITCDDGAGLCVADGSAFACLPRCADDGPTCADGERYATIAVSDGAPACYCDSRTPWVIEPIIRDHR